ncbi:MAG TPA: sigma-70 family RNA polymerase sigma factor, partial [Planctomycetota bacterium]|nr:sigma-70 family RNA polymerase sigma factor [Planctomycetota bacterium]
MIPGTPMSAPPPSPPPPPSAGGPRRGDLLPDALLSEMAWLRGLARSLTADPSVADDLVQEAWLATMRARPDTSRPLRPWLSRVLRNLHLQRRRSEGRRAVREGRVSAREKDGAHGPDDLVARLEVHRLLGDLVLSLEEPYRTAVLLRYMEGLAPDEVAARTRVLPATARSRVSRGLDRLRKHLDRRFGGDRLAWCLLFLRVEGLGPFAAAPADGWIDGPVGAARAPHAGPRAHPRGGFRAGSAGLASAGAAAVAFLLTAIGMHGLRGGGADDTVDRTALRGAAPGAVERTAAGVPAGGWGSRRGDGEPAEVAPAGDAADAYAEALDGSPEAAAARAAAGVEDGITAAEGLPAAVRGGAAAPGVATSAAAAAVPKSFRVAGRVVDPRGRGIAGARVDLLAPGALRGAVDPRELAASWLAPPRAAASATTDADGRFAASAPGEGPFHLRASGAGLLTAVEEGVLAGAPRTVVLAAGAAIEGRVRRDDGGPVADLAVAAFPAAGAPASFARTRP